MASPCQLRKGVVRQSRCCKLSLGAVALALLWRGKPVMEVANLKERRRKFVSLCKQVFLEKRLLA